MNPIIAYCFYIASVTYQANLDGIDNTKFTFGVKQMTEDLMLTKGHLFCDPEKVKGAEPV